MQDLKNKIQNEIFNANSQIQIIGEQDDYLCGWIDALEWVLKEINNES